MVGGVTCCCGWRVALPAAMGGALLLLLELEDSRNWVAVAGW